MHNVNSEKQTKLTVRDFAFVNDPEIGLSYQNCAYAILVGRGTYSCTYKGLTFSWGHESVTEAIEVVERHDRRIRRLNAISALNNRDAQYRNVRDN